jgi:hypothetical protein
MASKSGSNSLSIASTAAELFVIFSSMAAILPVDYAKNLVLSPQDEFAISRGVILQTYLPSRSRRQTFHAVHDLDGIPD